MTKVKAQPVYNSKGYVVSGQIKVQSQALEPGVHYEVVFIKIKNNGKDKKS